MSRFFRRKDTILFLLLAALIHILLTFLVSQRVGKVSQKEKDTPLSGVALERGIAAEVSQDKPGAPAKVPEGYRTISFCLSLPFDPLFQPVHRRWAAAPLRNGEIQFDEYVFRAGLLGTATRVLNSFFFSFFAYGVLYLTVRRIRQNKKNDKPGYGK